MNTYNWVSSFTVFEIKDGNNMQKPKKLLDRGYRLVTQNGQNYVTHKSIRYRCESPCRYGIKGIGMKTLSEAYSNLRYTLKMNRQIRKKTVTIAKTLLNHTFYTSSKNVFTEPGQFLAALTQIKIRNLKKGKIPKNQSKYIGVEIEFLNKFRRSKLESLAIEDKLEKFIELKSDGSVCADSDDNEESPCDYCTDGCQGCEDNGDECTCDCTCEDNRSEIQGHELTMLGTQNTIFERVVRVCDFLAKQNGYVNKTCGLHVHIDMRKRDRAKCYRNLVIMQPLLYSMVPVSRFNNTYSKSVPLDYTLDDGYSLDRYRSINAQSLEEHHTIEVRLHSGTVNAKKINMFINLLIAIVDAPPLDTLPLGALELQNALNIPLALVNYIYGRLQKFRGARLSSEGDNFDYLALSKQFDSNKQDTFDYSSREEISEVS